MKENNQEGFRVSGATFPRLGQSETPYVAPKAAIHRPRSALEIRKMAIEKRQLLHRGFHALALNGEEIERGNET